MFHLPRWLWLNHVPAGLDLTPEQYVELKRRMRAMGQAQQRGMGLGRRVVLRLAPATAALSLIFAWWIIWLAQAKLPPARFALLNVVSVLLFQVVIWVIVAWSINRAMAPMVWRGLNEIGFRVCTTCGYILDYLPMNEPKCPECGTALHPPSARAPMPVDSSRVS